MAIKYQIKKRYLFLGSLLGLVFITYLFSSSILQSYANIFRVDNATKGADCVLILSGNPETRPDRAAELIQANYASKLYHTDQKKRYKKHEDILGHPFEKAKKILATYNLSADIIPSTKGGATSTFDEAYDFAAFLQEHPMNHIILVTDSFHTARAYYAFKKVLDLNGFQNIHIEMSAAKNDLFNESNWWHSERGISAYILEPVKYLFYIFNSSNSKLIQEST